MSLANQRFYKPLLALGVVVLLAGSGRIQRGLNAERGKMGLSALPPLEKAPPLLAFTTVALGGFRGLIADALWVRASQLQQDDKFFEMVQLADWITKLQPHMVQVWVVEAWNMAYNISVKFPDKEDRWRWVRAGIELLRDEGLKYNPDEPLIYRELGWFYQHKIGANLDDANVYYKRELMREMTQALGGNGVPNYEQLLHPKTAEETNRVRNLEAVYKLDPEMMKKVDDKYGPLDWRLPEAHAIYWASLGLQRCKDTNLIVLRRMVYQSMQLGEQRGALTYDKTRTAFVLGPNLANVVNANKSYEEMLAIDEENRDNIATAHKHFLQMLPYYFYVYDRPAEGQKWLNYARKKYPGSIAENETLDEYALSLATEDVKETDHDKVTMLLVSMIRHELTALINDEDGSAANYDRLAQAVWKHFQHELRGGEKTKQRVGLSDFPTLKRTEIALFLDPKTGVNPEAQAILRTKLGLRANEVPSVFRPEGTNSVAKPGLTNAPPSRK